MTSIEAGNRRNHITLTAKETSQELQLLVDGKDIILAEAEQESKFQQKNSLSCEKHGMYS